jgi:hypothetical protein
MRGYSIGTTDERDLSCKPLTWPQLAYKFYEDFYRCSSNNKIIFQKFERL